VKYVNSTIKVDINILASFLIYARALLEYVIIIMWLRFVIKMLQSVKFAEDKVLTFLILYEKC